MRILKALLRIAVTIALVAAVAYGAVNYKDWLVKPSFSEEASTRHLIVVSLDALDAKEFDQFREMPNFKTLLDTGSYAREVVGVYPSLTYPSHTSIITGVYPGEHGIVNNLKIQPDKKSPDWFWYASDIRVPTLWGLAEKANMKVGALFWPVTAKAGIDYNLAEIWPNSEGQSQVWLSLSTGSPVLIASLQLKYAGMLNGTHQPELDNFTAAAAADLIRSKRPNLLLVHFTDADHQKHLYGYASGKAKAALKRQDERLGLLMTAVKEAGIGETTTFVVLGDHSFSDTNKKIDLNAEFVKRGLATADSQGNITGWKAYSNTCDGSTYIYLKDRNDSTLRDKVTGILAELQKNPDYCIEKVYSGAEAAKLGADPDCDFMLEAAKGAYFGNEINEGSIVDVTPNNMDYDKNLYAATHGYSYDKPGYRTFFLASGAGIRKGVEVPSISMLDEGPTMARLLGLKLPDARGRILNEILNESR